MYNLPRNCVSTWARTYETKGMIKEPHRPNIFGKKEEEALIGLVETGHYDIRSKSFNEKAKEFAYLRAKNYLKKMIAILNNHAE